MCVCVCVCVCVCLCVMHLVLVAASCKFELNCRYCSIVLIVSQLYSRKMFTTLLVLSPPSHSGGRYHHVLSFGEVDSIGVRTLLQQVNTAFSKEGWERRKGDLLDCRMLRSFIEEMELWTRLE